MKVLVTGGTGFVGKALQKVMPDWIYISSSDYNLLDAYQVRAAIRDNRNLDAIVHLAGVVGGIKDNAARQADYIYQNLIMNSNVIHGAYEEGVPKVLSALSTCAFPDNLERYPFNEGDLYKGAPAKTNFSYGYAKRCLHVMSVAYRKQYGVNYSTFTPSNIYGPGDNFSLNSSHFVAALVRKFHEARDGDTIEFWGSGKPLRQQLFVKDVANIIPRLLEVHNSDLPVIVAPTENLSIKEMIDVCQSMTAKEVKIKFSGDLDGQYRKDGENKGLLSLLGDVDFTSFKEGLGETYEWYERQN